MRVGRVRVCPHRDEAKQDSQASTLVRWYAPKAIPPHRLDQSGERCVNTSVHSSTRSLRECPSAFVTAAPAGERSNCQCSASLMKLHPMLGIVAFGHTTGAKALRVRTISVRNTRRGGSHPGRLLRE